MKDERMEQIFLKDNLLFLLEEYPYINNYFEAIRLETPKSAITLSKFVNSILEERFSDFGTSKFEFCQSIFELIDKVDNVGANEDFKLKSLTVTGGYDKDGKSSEVLLKVKTGSVIAIVGPTGSGKSRLLEDIECLAQNDTPTGRTVYINEELPKEDKRFRPDGHLIAEISQNMNFVIDLSVVDFLKVHAKSRGFKNENGLVEEIIEKANELSGEKFSPDTAVTQLSGGQSRALMIADAALLSPSPIVLIDEIENAGIDRSAALSLLTSKDKIVFMSTHDPILALMGDRRCIIKNGAIVKIIETSKSERKNLEFLSKADAFMTDIRESLRKGKEINLELSKKFMEEIKYDEI